MNKDIKRESVKKSTSSHVLTYDADFWSFYLRNKEDIDSYMHCIAKRYAKYLPVEDLINETLLRLYTLDILRPFDATIGKGYDHTKSCLNTYITNWIRWTMSHIVKIYKSRSKVCVPESNKTVDDTDQPAIVSNLISKLEKKLPSHKLVLQMILKGYSQVEIAKMFDVSRSKINLSVRRIRSLARQLYSASTGSAG